MPEYLQNIFLFRISWADSWQDGLWRCILCSTCLSWRKTVNRTTVRDQLLVIRWQCWEVVAVEQGHALFNRDTESKASTVASLAAEPAIPEEYMFAQLKAIKIEHTRWWETDSWREQAKPCVHQEPGERSSIHTRHWVGLACKYPEVSGGYPGVCGGGLRPNNRERTQPRPSTEN